jgi:hypothetical protein
MSRDEKITALAFAITVGLWIGGASLGVNSVAAATVGLTILLVTGEPFFHIVCQYNEHCIVVVDCWWWLWWWINAASLGVNSVAAATVGLAVLLVTGEPSLSMKHQHHDHDDCC